jgi:hypothetical protein
MVIFIVAAGFLAFGAVYILPSRSPVSAPGTFGIEHFVNLGVQITGIEVDVTADSAGDARNVRIKVFTTPTSSEGGEDVIARLSLPQGVSVRRCQDCQRIPGGVRFDETIQSGEYSYSPYLATLNMKVVGRPFAFDTNGVTAEVQIPSFDVALERAIFVTVHYHIPGAASYDWGGAPAAPNSVAKNEASWHEPLSNVTSTTPVDAIDHDAETQDNTLVFIAGIFLGIAGAALIAGVQELFQVLKDTRTARQADGPVREVV